MNDVSELPPDQVAICARCFHPTGTFVAFPEEDIEQSIPQRFEQIVRTLHDRIAVKVQDKTVTYGALNRVANRVARLIIDRLGGQNSPVVILSEHTITAIIFSLAIWKSGKILIALEPSLTQKQITSTLEAAQTKAILTSNENVSFARVLANGGGRQIVNVDPWAIDLSDENLELRIASDAPAEIRYSSGSTGQPKGIVRSHRRLLSSARSTINSVHICPDDRLVALTNLSFGTRDLLRGLLSGAALFPFDIKKEGIANLAQLLTRERITCYHSVPSIFRYLVRQLERPDSFPSMRSIQLGGELLYRSDVESYKRFFSHDCVLLNSLSAGETGNLCVLFMDKNTKIDTAIVPVGYPIKGKSIFLLNDAGEKIGPNEVGEIAVRSRNLSSGYWNSPDLTEAKFRTDPRTDQKVYSTGDLAKVLPDGRLLYLGRKDNEVKIRGIKIELTEIDATLLDHEAIVEAVTLLKSVKNIGESLTAYIVPKTRMRPKVGDLRRFLRKTLPEYMIPSSYVFMEALPLTPNGKVDRRALPDPDQSRPELETPYLAPATPVEAKLAQLWAQALTIDRVGIHDNFFDLGGHSLLAANLTSQIEKAFGKTLPLAAFYQGPTIDQLANVLTETGLPLQRSLVVPLQPYGPKPPFFCHGASLEIALGVGPDQPFYGLQPHGQNGEKAPTTIEEMAADYIRQIRTVQSKGPYYLGGYSFGGMVAFEMAQQLRKEGENVPLLVLIDAGGPIKGVSPDNSALSVSSVSFKQKVYQRLQGFQQFGVREKFTFALAMAQWRCEKIKNKANAMACRAYLGINRRIPDSLRMSYFFEVSHQARRKYRAQIYPGRIVFIKAEKSPERWMGLAAEGIEVREIRGKHLDVLRDPQARKLATELKGLVEKTQVNA